MDGLGDVTGDRGPASRPSSTTPGSLSTPAWASCRYPMPRVRSVVEVTGPIALDFQHGCACSLPLTIPPLLVECAIGAASLKCDAITHDRSWHFAHSFDCAQMRELQPQPSPGHWIMCNCPPFTTRRWPLSAESL